MKKIFKMMLVLVFISNITTANDLHLIKDCVLKSDSINIKDKKEIIKLADKFLNIKPFSIVNKTGVSASGDKHDYFTLAPYFWPNPAKKRWFTLHEERRGGKPRRQN